MFAYARLDGLYCDVLAGGCQCFCQTIAKHDGTCDMKDDKDWDLYSLVKNKPSKSCRSLHHFEDNLCFLTLQ